MISVLSPFLYIGLISEYFNLSGNIPVESILLHICVKVDTINGLLIFRTFVVISSYPHELLLFNSLIIFSISPVVVEFVDLRNYISVCMHVHVLLPKYGLVIGCQISFSFFLSPPLPTWHYRFRGDWFQNCCTFCATNFICRCVLFPQISFISFISSILQRHSLVNFTGQ